MKTIGCIMIIFFIRVLFGMFFFIYINNYAIHVLHANVFHPALPLLGWSMR